MIEPVLKDDTLLADIMAARQDPDHFHLWWLGQSGYLIQWSGRHLLLDPYLSDSLTRKYADTAIPHVRMTERVIAPERLDFIDVVTSSHNHTAHLDGETLGHLLRVTPDMALVIQEANPQVVAVRPPTAPGTARSRKPRASRRSPRPLRARRDRPPGRAPAGGSVSEAIYRAGPCVAITPHAAICPKRPADPRPKRTATPAEAPCLEEKIERMLSGHG